MKKEVKRKYKEIIAFIIGGMIFGSIGVYATINLSSSEITYDNKLSGIKATTLKGAIDELYEKAKSCESGGSGDSGESNPKGNFMAAYTYNSSTCITGEESSCQKTECYNNKTKGSCPNGTIIKYKVTDTVAKYFHVIHDDGETMTMQQRENTIYNRGWYSSQDTTKGPLTVLPELEKATKDWTNVNLQTYTMGTTNFNGTNAYTGCSANDSTGIITCSRNVYTLGARTARARMITVQETVSLGCKRRSKSCPNYMNNYLYKSTENGGTVNDDRDSSGYWTMGARSSSQNVFIMEYDGSVNYSANPTNPYYGGRAVVVVSK